MDFLFADGLVCGAYEWCVSMTTLGLAASPRITPEALRRAFDDLPNELHANSKAEGLALGSAVIRAFLGDKWFDRFVISDDQKKGFFSVDESNETTLDQSFFRIIDLAELFYNLQDTHGFSQCIERMRQGNLEPTLAELDFGRMLYFNQVPFRFVPPRGRRGCDYDIEIIYPGGFVVCADAKCKLEGTEPSERTILNTLHGGRKQLPLDRPGILFIKTPPTWVRNAQTVELMLDVARCYLRGTQSVVSVKYYASEIAVSKDGLTHTHLYREVANPRTKYGNNKNWDIFQRRVADGMPPHWRRLLFFPDGKPR
jgi:hypothetical protein